MKIIIRFTSIFLLSLLSYSCFSQNKYQQTEDAYNKLNSLYPKEYEQAKKEYNDIFLLYPKELVSHFPNSDGGTILYVNLIHPGASNISAAYAAFLYSKDQVSEIENKIKLVAKKKYHFTDSCLMVVNYDSTLYDSMIFRLVQCKDFSGRLPIPNFQFCGDSPLPKDFYDKANIYILDAHKGRYLYEKYLHNEGVGLPAEWLNGYTKGVIIGSNLNIVIFWFEVW